MLFRGAENARHLHKVKVFDANGKTHRGVRCGSGCETLADSAFLSGFMAACGFATTAGVEDWFAEVDADFPANDAQEIGFWAGTIHSIYTAN